MGCALVQVLCFQEYVLGFQLSSELHVGLEHLLVNFDTIVP